jgi:hypothetical protein
MHENVERRSPAHGHQQRTRVSGSTGLGDEVQEADAALAALGDTLAETFDPGSFGFPW